MATDTPARPGWTGYQLPPLAYADSGLPPVITAEDLRLHHDVIHQGYVDALNRELRAHPQWQGLSIEALLRDLHRMPPALRARVADPAGGHANHQFFWKVIAPHAGGVPRGELARALAGQFGSFDGFRSAFTSAALALPTQGWAFLVADPAQDHALRVLALPGNESVLPLGLLGLLVCDLWEHAWPRNADADREAWITHWWTLVDWAVVGRRYDTFRAGGLQA